MSARRADIAYFASVAVSLIAIVLVGALRRRLELIGEDDLSRIWAGPRAVLTGHDPYDPSTWIATAAALHTQLPDTSVYVYPPWAATLLLPLGLLPLPVASVVWLIAGLAVAVLVVRAALRAFVPGRPVDHAVSAAALLLSWVGLLAMIIGQWGYFLVAALLGATLALRSGRWLAAGLALVALIAKPQLFLFTAPAFAVHALVPRSPGARVWTTGARAIAVATLGALALVAVGWILLPSWWPTWVLRVGTQQTRPFSDTLAALLVTVAGPGADIAAPAIILALAAIALAFEPRGLAWLAVWTALSIVGAPYTNSYDQILLLVPVILAAGALHERAPRASRLVLWTGTGILLVVTPLMYEIAVRRHSETFGALVSLAIYALVCGSLWRYRRERATVAT